jgi:hypothetical protein
MGGIMARYACLGADELAYRYAVAVRAVVRHRRREAERARLEWLQVRLEWLQVMIVPSRGQSRRSVDGRPGAPDPPITGHRADLDQRAMRSWLTARWCQKAS